LRNGLRNWIQEVGVGLRNGLRNLCCIWFKKWFYKLDTKCGGGFEKYSVVFGLRNGLRNWIQNGGGGFEKYSIVFVLRNWIQNGGVGFEEYIFR